MDHSGYIFQQLLNGIQLGSMYALIALGYTMVYGIIKLINFAHADIFMVGAYAAFFIVSFVAGASGAESVRLWIWFAIMAGYLLFAMLGERWAPLRSGLHRLDGRAANGRTAAIRGFFSAISAVAHLAGIAACAAILAPLFVLAGRFVSSIAQGALALPVVLACVMLLCALLGVAMERIAYRPLRHKPRLSALITALGVSLFLENFCSLDIVFSNRYRAFPELLKKAEVLRIDPPGIGITNIFLVNLAVLAVLLAALWFLVEKTLIGKQMRAVAFDKRAAALMGINVDRVIAFTFVIGPALAGVSGVLFAMNYGILQSPFLGFYPGLKAFVAAVLGGIGSLPGAVVGALVLGICEVFANSIDSNLGFAAAFVILIAILLVKPTGLLGKRESEKV